MRKRKRTVGTIVAHTVATLFLTVGLAIGSADGQIVGYYTDFSPGATGWEQPITDNGFTAIQVLDITTFDFNTVDIMLINEQNNSAISAELLSRVSDLEAYVLDGGKVVIHDRYVTNNSFIPGGGAINLVRDFSFDDDLDVVTPGTLVTEGPFGIVDDSTLDGGNSSNHGWALNLPDGTTTILSAGPDPSRAAAFSYFLDAGVVYYSSIPLDFYLAGSGPPALQAAMANIYAPNVVAYMNAISGVITADRTLIVKQGACPAPVNPSSNGLTPMLLVGEDDFDVSQVVLASLELSRCDGVGDAVAHHSGPPGPGIQIVDLNHPNDDDVGCEDEQVPCACNEDQSSDGIDDLKLKFRTSDMAEAFQLDGVPGGTTITLFLTGELTDGTQFVAADCIRVVGPPEPPGLLAVVSTESGVWIDATPSDLILDGGGFAPFERSHPLGTIVTLTAPLTHNGEFFTGWVVNGDGVPYLSRTVVIIVDGETTTAVASYRPQRSDVRDTAPSR